MSGLIRHAEAGALRRFTTAPPVPATADPSAPLHARIAALEAALAAAEVALDEARDDADRREQAAVEAGRRAALVDETARVAAVSSGIAQVCAQLDQRLAWTETLALALAELGLEKLFGQVGALGPLVDATVRHAVSEVREGLALRVRVSPADFAGDAADALRSAIEPLPLALDVGLAAGEAQLELRLGAIDLSLDAQWHRLREALRSLAGGAA